MTALPDQLLRLPPAEVEELACRAHLGVWTARRRKLPMAPFHWEWCELAMTQRRLAIVAPRDHSKSETFSVNATTWRSQYQIGVWTYIFMQTGDQAKEMITRVESAMEETCPQLVDPPRRRTANDILFQNGSRVTAAGAGKAVRGAHPDFIVGDDVLEERSATTELERKRVDRWWKGTVANMAHPGSVRAVRMDQHSEPVRVVMPPTRVFLVGTPFHEQDLLLGMRSNPLYAYRRYAAEFRPEDLVPGTWAVEVS